MPKKTPKSSFSFKHIFTKYVFSYILIFVFLIPFYVVLYKLYIPHINSFGCFDECINYIGGYFLLKGRSLYDQIFFNHQPLIAYISWFVLKVSHPANMFEALLRYKQFLFLIGFIANFFIIKRFKWAGVGFVIIFELSKYYLFGDRFLAESIIVYPLVYLTGLLIYKLENKKIYPVEYILSGILVWFVIFSREPFILVSLAQLALLLGIPKNIYQKLGYAIFFALCIGTLLFLPMHEYFYQVFTINSLGVGRADVQSGGLFGWGILQVFLYPFLIFFGGEWNEFRTLLVGISLVFSLVSLQLLDTKQYKKFIVVLGVLGLANLRPIVPGQLFYSSFHIIPWFGMFVLATLVLIAKLKNTQRLFYLCVAIIILTEITFVSTSKNFIFFRIDQQVEFVINFGQSYEIGNVVHTLAQSKNTFFIDRRDDIDIAYLTANLASPYKYSDFGFVAPGYPPFHNAYVTMWSNNPPDFYFGAYIPKAKRSLYQALLKEGKPSDLYVKKSVLQKIPDTSWNNILQFGYIKPQAAR